MYRSKLVLFLLLNIFKISNNFDLRYLLGNFKLTDYNLFANTENYYNQKIVGQYNRDVLSVLNSNQLESILELAQVDGKFTPIDPEAFMSVDEIIRYHGYPVENYNIRTDDGYFLTIQRIPYGKDGKYLSKSRKPVLLQHGIWCSSATWVSNTADKNLPFILADSGYDVWLGNIRGTEFGGRSANYKTDDKKFWEFSFDEMAKYDIPKVIDTILDVTGFKHIYYIGHSMGTTIAFAMLSSQTKYNQIIKGVFALAPVAKLTHMRGVMRYIVTFADDLSWLLESLADNRFSMTKSITQIMSRTVCNSRLKILCQNFIFLISGYDYSQLNVSRLPVFLRHTPAATSVQNLHHFAQMFHSEKFQHQDFGADANLAKYGRTQPPMYDLTKISAPVALFWSDNDYLADPRDVSWLASQLKSVVLNYRVPYDKFSHLDFMWAVDVKPLLYDKLVDVMNKMWQ